MFLGLPDPHPEPLVTSTDPDPVPDPSIIKQNNKKKTLILLFCDFFDILLVFPDPHPEPDPYVFGPPGSASGTGSVGSLCFWASQIRIQNVTDPQHCQ
jgi:hypothetical protein